MIVDEKIFAKFKKLNHDIDIVYASAKDDRYFAYLNNKYFARSLTPEYFHWRYFRKQDCILFVAKKKNLVVGYAGIQIRTLSNSRLCGVTTDVLIDKEFRGRGILVLLEYAMEKYCRERSAIAMVVFANPIGKKAFERAGNWKITGTISILLHTPKQQNGNKKKNISSSAKNSNKRIYFQSSTEYRHWRFDLNPRYKYTKVQLDNRFFAYTKLFIDPKNPVKVGDIVDCNWSRIRLSTQKRLLVKTIASFPQDLDSVASWALPGTKFYQALTGIGFKKTDKETAFCVKVLNSRYKYLYNLDSWHIVQADSEVF